MSYDELERSPSSVYDEIEMKGVQQLTTHLKDLRLRDFVGTGGSLALQFDLNTQRQILSLIQDFVSEAQASGLQIASAGQDYPLHATVRDGKYPKPQDKVPVSQELLDKVAADPKMQNIQVLLSGLSISFNRVVIGEGGAIMLAATDVPKNVQEARQEMDTLYRLHGLEPKKGDDILFCTGARLSTRNKAVTPDQAQTYFNAARTFQERVSSNPILTITAQPYFGPSAKLIPK